MLHISSNSLSFISGEIFINVVFVLDGSLEINLIIFSFFCKSLKPGVLGDEMLMVM